MNYKHSWSDYYKRTKNQRPSPLLISALQYVPHRNQAIDVGGGALRDTRYLLEQGFDVTVIDSEPQMLIESKNISSSKLNPICTTFSNFKFPVNTFDIASAMYSLPFNPPDSLPSVFADIKSSLVDKGIFCGQLFGIRDEWSRNRSMTFHTYDQVLQLLSDMEIISLHEEDKDGKTATGTPKHWHVFHFIARK